MTEFEKLCEIVATLRAPGGCPWDREQTNESLLSATIEGAYEVAEAARSKNEAHFREELGDLLLLVVMHAEIARETGYFDIDIDKVIVELTEKLIRRHPHVFALQAPLPAAQHDAKVVLKQWEAIKHAEKKDATHYLASLPKALPALMRAEKAQEKAARVNFDWRELGDVLAKVDEELQETKAALASADKARISDEIGDLLFAVVNLARKCQLEAESLLQAATDKFIARFNQMEDRLRAYGGKLGDASLQELDAIWDEIKEQRNDKTQY